MPKPPVARWISRRLVELHLTQQQAAQVAGLSLSGVRNFCRRGLAQDRIRPEVFEAIARMLAIDVEQVYELANNRIPRIPTIKDKASSASSAKDDRLAELARRWPALPPHVKAAIMILVSK